MAESLEDIQRKILEREVELEKETDKATRNVLLQLLVQLRENENLLLRQQTGVGNLRQAIEELTLYAISPSAFARVQESLFALNSKEEQDQMSESDCDDSYPYCCVGFFFEAPYQAVTANHCLGKNHEVGDIVSAYSPFYKRSFQLTVVLRDDDLDVAILKRADATVGDDLGKTFLKKHGGLMVPGRKVALCSCSIRITKELAETEPGISVYDATINRYSHTKRHIVYQCPTFTGDYGLALIMYDGKVVGLHREGVHQFKERIGQKQCTKDRLNDLEASVASAVAGVAHGALAVALHDFASLLGPVGHQGTS